jgi:RHS repeat-associated protein
MDLLWRFNDAKRIELGCHRTHSALWFILLVAILAPNACVAASDTCGTEAYCVGPEVGPYRYQVADGYTSAQGSAEAETIAAYRQKISDAYNACSVTLTDALPPWQSPGIGTGSANDGDYTTALRDGSTHYWGLTWRLSTEYVAQRIPLILNVTYPKDSSPPCKNSLGPKGVYVHRVRDVACPNPPTFAPNTSPVSGSYCFRAKSRRDPFKNLGGQCPIGGPSLMLGNPTNVATGNKLQLEADYAAAPGGLVFQRYYNSQLWKGPNAPSANGPGYRSRLGPSWRSNYDRYIRFTNSVSIATAYAYRFDGRTLYFNLVGDQFVADGDVADRLLRLSDSSGNILGWRYIVAATEEVESYDAVGRLITITSRSGVTQSLTYDGQLLQSVADSFGRTLSFGYDSSGRLATLTDPYGRTYSYFYTGATANLTAVVHPDGTSRSYIYNESIHTNGANLPYTLTGIIDEGGNRFATYKYNSGSAVTSSEHAGGADAYRFTYSASSTAVTDPAGTQRTYTFTNLLGVARTTAMSQPCATGCAGAAASTAYDISGNVASRTDFNGRKTCYAYDGARNLETARLEGLAAGLDCPANLSTYTPPSGTRQRKITTGWHPAYRLPTQIDEPGKRTTFTHDLSGNVLTRTITDLSTASSVSRTWAYTYNSFGKVLTADGPRTDVSDVTMYSYYECSTGYQCGQIETVINAAGHTTTYNTYNAHGQPLTITDANGVVTTLTYDLRQRLKSRTVGSEVTSFDYWPTGLLKKATLPDGSYLEYTYDAAHRLTDINDADGNRIHYTLDAMGNRTKEELYDPSNALAQKRIRVFDALNRLHEEIGAANPATVTTTYGYDNNGNQTSIAAPLGRGATQIYDELNRLTQITDPLNGVTHYGYNALDQLISVTDPRSKVTSYTYDAFGSLLQQVSPDTGTTTNTYDAAGNLLTSTDARSLTATYSYDALNRVISVSYPDQTISYTYDTGSNQNGRLTQVTNNSGSTSWSYDRQGRVLSKQQNMGITRSVGYAYDLSGRMQTMTLPSGNSVTYGYSDGKVTSLTLNGSISLLTDVLYEPFGPTRGWTWGNGTFSVRQYNTDGLITGVDSAGLKTYSHDDAFRITSITDADNASLDQSYGYDLLDRLTSAAGPSLNQGWTYDANGNRLTQNGSAASTFTISGTSNRLSSVTGALTRTYSYDNAGNTTSDGAATFVYNNAGRMVSATKLGTTTTYAYNALGQRVSKTRSGSSRYFVYDEAGHLLGEYDNAGALIQETVWLGDTPVATLRPNGASVDVFYVHSDHLNTPRKITRPSDNVVVWRWDGDPFGTTMANEDPDGDAIAVSYGLRFPGQYFDAETGLSYNYFRDYDPATGRYVQSDPIGLGGGINTYGYVSANPISFYDPTGLERDSGRPSPNEIERMKQQDCARRAFLRNYQDMRAANWQLSDKYFHCKANCEAARCGQYGYDEACNLSDSRETFDRIKGDPASASAADQSANRYGRDTANKNPSQTCQIVCAPYRPNGLPSQY